MNRNKAQHYLEESLTKLIGSMQANLDETNREILINFLDNREFGVALEWLYSIVLERHLQLSEWQQLEVERLADFMGIDLSKAV